MPWPFARRSGRSAKAKEAGSTGVAGAQRPASPVASKRHDSDALKRTPSRRSNRRRRRSSRSTQSMRDADQNSPVLPPVNPPFAKNNHHHPHAHGSAEDITALPYTQTLTTSPHLRPVTLESNTPYNFQLNSHGALPTARERGKLQRPQSLRKRAANDTTPVRRKSTKKRKNDHVREEEIRAMSMPLPQKRPAGSSGGILRRESKKVKGGLNRSFERPTSNISLPPEDSIHSSMSGSSESRAFRVSALDMFSPRPKIRYSAGSQPYGYSSPPLGASRSNSKKERPTTNSKDGYESHKSKRIDDLADTLDAGALREILERDKRRRDKKRRADDEKLRRRLERRAEKQRAAEQAAAAGTPATPRHGARGAVGLGIEGDTSTPMEDVRPSTPTRPQNISIPPATTALDANSQRLPTPLDSPAEEPTVADAKAVHYSRASVSPPASPVQTHARESSNISQMPDLLSETVGRYTPPPEPVQAAPLHPVESIQTSETSKKGSGRRRSSEGRRMSAFASWFRRGKRRSSEQGRMAHQDMHSSEVSFSNTSRESMSRQPLPAHLVGNEPIQIRRPSSNIPKRTMSKFREDLPEYPMSPPDSRVHSPEVNTTSAIAARRGSQPPSNINVDSSTTTTVGDDTIQGTRTDSPVSVPPAGVMSQSLASVDSEGSWLSGKPMNRRSNKSHFRTSVSSSTAPQQAENFNASYEQLDIPEDEYFRRLTPQPDDHQRSVRSSDPLARKPSSTAIGAAAAESDDEQPPSTERMSDDDNLVQQKTVGRQPTVVHRQNRAKSVEGLLSFYSGEEPSSEGAPAKAEESSEQGSPMSETEPVSLQRATSVELGKRHVRQLSAGSARLLDIPAKRASVDQKRSSLTSQTEV